MNKFLSMLLIVILLLALWGCKQSAPPQETSTTSAMANTVPTALETTTTFTTKAPTSKEQALKIYEEFLAGKRTAKIRWYEDGSIIDGDNTVLEWIDYAFYDMNGDGIPELHVRASGIYRILTCGDGEPIIWATPGIDAKPLDNGAILSARNNLYEMQYHYIEYDFFGNEQLRIDFAKFGPNDKGVYDENSAYYFKDEQVSREEWDTLTEKYFSIGSDKIKWIDAAAQRENPQ